MVISRQMVCKSSKLRQPNELPRSRHASVASNPIQQHQLSPGFLLTVTDGTHVKKSFGSVHADCTY